MVTFVNSVVIPFLLDRELTLAGNAVIVTGVSKLLYLVVSASHDIGYAVYESFILSLELVSLEVGHAGGLVFGVRQ